MQAFSDEETHCLVVIQYLLCDELKLSVNNSSMWHCAVLAGHRGHSESRNVC